MLLALLSPVTHEEELPRSSTTEPLLAALPAGVSLVLGGEPVMLTQLESEYVGTDWLLILRGSLSHMSRSSTLPAFENGVIGLEPSMSRWSGPGCCTM